MTGVQTCALPIFGVVRVGEVAQTRLPLPVKVFPLILVSVASTGWYALDAVNAAVPSVPPVPMFNVELSVPASVKVFETLRVFAFVTVKVPVLVEIVSPLIDVAVATPKNGVVKVGEVDKTTDPLPVDVVTPVPPLFTAMVVPLQTPVVIVPTVTIELLPAKGD